MKHLKQRHRKQKMLYIFTESPEVTVQQTHMHTAMIFPTLKHLHDAHQSARLLLCA